LLTISFLSFILFLSVFSRPFCHVRPGPYAERPGWQRPSQRLRWSGRRSHAMLRSPLAIASTAPGA